MFSKIICTFVPDFTPDPLGIKMAHVGLCATHIPNNCTREHIIYDEEKIFVGFVDADGDGCQGSAEVF